MLAKESRLEKFSCDAELGFLGCADGITDLIVNVNISVIDSSGVVLSILTRK